MIRREGNSGGVKGCIASAEDVEVERPNNKDATVVVNKGPNTTRSNTVTRNLLPA